MVKGIKPVFIVLSAVFLLSQFLLAQHAYQHLNAPASYDCQLCVHADLLGEAAVAAVLLLACLSFVYFPRINRSIHVAAKINFYAIRAPPLHSHS